MTQSNRFSCYHGLAEGDAAVVGGNLPVDEHFKSVGAQQLDGLDQQQAVLEAPSAQSNRLQSRLLPDPAADS